MVNLKTIDFWLLIMLSGILVISSVAISGIIYGFETEMTPIQKHVCISGFILLIGGFILSTIFVKSKI